VLSGLSIQVRDLAFSGKGFLHSAVVKTTSGEKIPFESPHTKFWPLFTFEVHTPFWKIFDGVG
jgi:hypothetical protein